MDNRKKKYSNRDLITMLQQFSKRENRAPIKRRNELRASPATFQRRFGSWNKALEAAGIDVVIRMNERVEVSCKHCSVLFTKMPSEIKKESNNFCTRSCSATYNNKHKTHGTRRSKLEAWMEEKLVVLYPDLEIHFNRKDAINSELDIFMPTLNLAIELNGIFHFEPIYGPEKLAKIINNDDRKFQACIERGIELCIIDTSQLKYCIPKNAKKYLDIVIGVIESRQDSNLRPSY